MSEEKRPTEGLPDAEFTELLQAASAMAPLLKSFLAPRGAPPKMPEAIEAPHGCRRREALLLALKPYLSPERCEAVDYLVRLARVGDAIRALK